ncbi:MAG: hypothetical protein AAGJ40_21710 [Planctomycetota bacterium]
MKLDPSLPHRRNPLGLSVWVWIVSSLMALIAEPSMVAGADSPTSHLAARQLIGRSITLFAAGDAFNAKVRQRVWVGGREVVGVGTYEQAGASTGQFNLQITMHDGDGKHSLQQVSDGRLAWTRQDIGGRVSLRRVDVGRLDQWVRGGVASNSQLPPSSRIGAWTELLESIATDYRLQVAPGTLQERSVWIIRGALSTEVRTSRLEELGSDELPELMPVQVILAIARENDPETGFGKGLPIRIEFRAAPAVVASNQGGASNHGDSVEADSVSSQSNMKLGQLISLMEMYAVRPILPPPIARFRFDHQDAEVNFVNETDRYLDRYQIRLTERETRVLRR